MTIDEYILDHISPEPEYLQRLYRATHLHLLNPRMASGHLQGRLLKMLVELTNATNIIEIGTYSGYSALSMAEGLKEGGKVYTFEVDDELEDFTRSWIDASPLADKIEFVIGDALTEVPKLDIYFDLAFVDGDKRHYIDYYEMLLPKMRQGALLLADNTLWDSHVTDDAYLNDKQTQGINNFNNHLKNDNRIETVILPLRDGLTMIRKK